MRLQVKQVYFGLFLIVWGQVAKAQEIKLEYQYKTGDQWRTKNTLHQQITGEALRGRTFETISESFQTIYVESVDESGISSIVRRQDSVAAKVNGQPVANPTGESLNGIPIRRKLLKNGKCLEVSSDTEGSSDLERTMNLLRQECQNNAGFPEKLLKIGESWTEEQVYNQDLGGITFDYTIKSTHRLLGFEKHAGYDCTVFRVTSQLDGALTLDEGSGTVTGTGRGSRFFAIKEGRDVRVFMDLTATREVVTPKGKMQMRIVLNIKEELIK